MPVDSGVTQEESKVGGGMYTYSAGDIPAQLYVCTTCDTLSSL